MTFTNESPHSTKAYHVVRYLKQRYLLWLPLLGPWARLLTVSAQGVPYPKLTFLTSWYMQRKEFYCAVIALSISVNTVKKQRESKKLLTWTTGISGSKESFDQTQVKRRWCLCNINTGSTSTCLPTLNISMPLVHSMPCYVLGLASSANNESVSYTQNNICKVKY